jgi:hypothetical protein
VHLNDIFKLRSIHLYKFIFCLIIGLASFPSGNIYAQSRQLVYDSAFVSSHSPIKAQLYSAVLPGLGQIYNHKYWKVPIIYGIGGAVIFMFLYNKDIYDDLNDAYIEVYNMDTPPTSYEFRGRLIPSGNIEETLRVAKNDARKYKDYCIVGIAAVYFLNIIDAMIDAYFLKYDVSDDISLDLSPVITSNDLYASSMGIRLSIKF